MSNAKWLARLLMASATASSCPTTGIHDELDCSETDCASTWTHE